MFTLCCSGAKPRRWTSPLVTRFGVIPRVGYNEGLIFFLVIQDLFLSCGLQNSQLTAKGGIIGGQIELKNLYANCRLLEPILAEPRHKLCVMMRSLDGRIEYMGGCIMMGKLTGGKLKLSDEWKGPKLSIPTSVEKR